MAKKLSTPPTKTQTDSAPKSLDDHIFWGLTLDPEQKAFRDAMYNSENLVVMCDAKAGCGKTLVAVATGLLMVKFGLYDAVTYIMSVGQERHLGYLPGSEQEKVACYRGALFDALVKLNISPENVLCDNGINQKNGNGLIEFITPTYKRGVNLSRRFVIYDESQNASLSDLKKMFTRIHDDSKLVCIGHSKQRDIFYNKNGFEMYLDHAKDVPFCEVCKLTTNHRGKISAWADELEDGL